MEEGFDGGVDGFGIFEGGVMRTARDLDVGGLGELFSEAFGAFGGSHPVVCSSGDKGRDIDLMEKRFDGVLIGSFDDIEESAEGLGGVDGGKIDEGVVVVGDKAGKAEALLPEPREAETALDQALEGLVDGA